MREEAPDALRSAIATSARHAGLGFNEVRQIVCQALAVAPDTRGNWSEPNVMAEVEQLLEDCHWFEVYEVIEAIAESLFNRPPPTIYRQKPPLEVFTNDINRIFLKNGIGWQLFLISVEMRGSEVFESAVREGRDALWKAGKRTSGNELHEALRDLSRRPEPELTGAIQHGIAALECLAKDLTGGDKETLGKLVQHNPSLFPSPLGEAVAKVYGFASNNGRHLKEGGAPSFEEAELVVGLSGVLCRYLERKIPKP
ncbi:hypothetical protein LTT95_07030 [Luteimonas sp. A1P009]|uniref:HEPN AbiJ-N-terminal domain-containing protein n=1 Tax=Luteimonas fraxinea TaxID=2901869 RepID=A0ABS8UDA0_9GAMM|nr:hypothetical protein [Luteimonas fraxinea]